MKLTNFLTLWLVAALASGSAFAKDVKVKVKQPGTLSQLVKAKDRRQATGLVIRGAINNDDIRFLRELCGGVGEKNSEGQVRRVDLHDVTFAPGGEPFSAGPGVCRTRGPHTVPDGMFYGCPVEEVVLPARTDTLGQRALAQTALRRIVVPEATVIADNAFAGDSLLEELTLPDIHYELDTRLLLKGMTSLRKLTFRNMDYISAYTFCNLPALEELNFNGMVGHIDGYCVESLPRLRSIRFGGTVLSTGGSQFVKDCPELERVVFDGTVFCIGYGAAVDCPKFQGYEVNGFVVESEDTTQIPMTPQEKCMAYRGWGHGLAEAADWISRYADTASFFSQLALIRLPTVVGVARAVGDTTALARLEKIQKKYEATQGKTGRTYLETLQLSAPYVRSGQREPSFSYMPPTDSLLCRTREYFNLDSIAGRGDEISRIKNLLYWLHDLVRHDGNSNWPSCHFNAVDLYETCQRENRGLNCRFLAMMLNEVLLAEGIPARYLTCQSQLYGSDSDCHVINVAWSTSLKKWIWVDPTFAAYVTDENGLLLHPGEVRERLQKNLPLVLNEDANWNHEAKQTVDDYLKVYMAKNLYVISANTLNQSEPEGQANHPQGDSVALAPKDFMFNQATVVTTDDEYFWQAPEGVE